nr:hypothetical protein Iba_chr13fCG10130 [Ipomoea batatas]GMD87038.1 hypothetical protein Iba_chr14bCG11900 [Ipomoea batatas]
MIATDLDALSTVSVSSVASSLILSTSGTSLSKSQIESNSWPKPRISSFKTIEVSPTGSRVSVTGSFAAAGSDTATCSASIDGSVTTSGSVTTTGSTSVAGSISPNKSFSKS